MQNSTNLLLFVGCHHGNTDASCQ